MDMQQSRRIQNCCTYTYMVYYQRCLLYVHFYILYEEHSKYQST